MFYLYILKSSLDDNLYIGITNNPKRRLSQHLKKDKRKSYYSANWIQKVISNGGKISMDIIFENLDKDSAVEYEKFYIKLFKDFNKKLTNISEGGLGFNHKGIPHSESHKRNLEKSQPHKIRISKENLYDLYVNKKLSKKSIGEIYGCGPTSINRRLIEHDIIPRKTKNYKAGRDLNLNDILELLKKDISILRISKKYKVGAGCVRDFLIKNNISTKNKFTEKIKYINKYDLDGNFIKNYNKEELCVELNKRWVNIYKYIKSSDKCWGYKWEIVYKQNVEI